MGGHTFSFKQFSLSQDRCAMKIGTDGVLLGAWCSVDGRMRVLDIGTGTGLVALMVAQRNAQALIEAVEIDSEAAAQARENFNGSPWAERLSVFDESFESFAAQQTLRYDLVVSNPPYFENSLKAGNEQRTAARHTGSLSFENLVAGAASVLSAQGIFSLIIPFEAAQRIIGIAASNGLHLRRRLDVRGNAGVECKRALLELGFEKPADLHQGELIVEKERHIYTDDYIALTREFYIKM